MKHFPGTPERPNSGHLEKRSEGVRVHAAGDAIVATTMDAATALRALPKAELHVHLESAISPERTFELARENGVSIGFGTAEQLSAAYEFTDLDSFLKLLWLGNDALRKQADFYELGYGYLKSAHRDGVLHAEVFLSP